MRKNVGSIDKLVRLLIAIALIVLFYLEIITGTLGIIALVLALVLSITSLVSFCPIYALFGLSSCEKEKTKE